MEVQVLMKPFVRLYRLSLNNKGVAGVTYGGVSPDEALCEAVQTEPE